MTANLAQRSASSPAQDAQALRRVFESLQAESCPRFYNFHMHTIHSDGQLQPEQVIEQAIELGLHGLAITDHHSVGGYLKAQQHLDQQAKRLWAQSAPQSAPLPHLWTGVEITAELLGIEVHILCYAFDFHEPVMQPYLQGHSVTGEAATAKQIIAAVHVAGGLAVLAHPARYKRSPQELIPAAAQLGIDGIEAFYAYNNPSPWQPSPKQTSEVLQLGHNYHLLNTCGTDTHGLSLLQRL